MGRVLVGTCSWTDPTLVKETSFYPETVRSPEERLRFYASQYPVVEVDSTYYRLPTEDQSLAWVDRTPPGFVFDIKAFRLFSLHPTESKSLPPDLRGAIPEALARKRALYLSDLPEELRRELWDRFRQALAPLHLAGKLGAVLLQFPRWVFPSHESRAHILAASEALAGYRLAVEFRDGSWVSDKNRDRSFGFLKEHGLTYVCVDEPAVERSVPPIIAVTSELAMVRFHGRNAESWSARNATAAERFRYLYSEDELREWVPKLKELADRSAEMHALMNNCYRDYGTTNARQLAQMLAD